MALNDVKEIQIPDSRYRQLEYIKFSGAEYVNTWLLIPGNTSYKRFDLKVNLQNITSWGINGTDSSGDIRFNIGVNGNGYTRIGVGNKNTWADSDGVLLTLNTDYVLSLEVNGNAVGRVYDSQGTLIGSGATLSSISFSGNPNVLYIGASNYDNTVSSYLEEKVYNVVVRLGDASNLTSNLIPCQRKSDNICGFYDTVRNAFYSMSGTTITDDAAGPIVAENMPMYVNKIESNNQIIWGSESAFPYRRLEYIHFSGAERIDTRTKPQVHFYYLNCKVQKRTDNWSFIWGAAHNVNNTFFRLFWQGNTDGKLNPRLKDTNTDFVSNTGNKIIQLRLRNYDTNNTSGTFWWACQDLNGDGLSNGDNTTQMMGKYYNNSTYACNFNNFNTTISIGQYHSNGSWTSAGSQAIMDVYRYFIRSTDGGSDIVNDQYPCQRKSDGICGLYDIKTNTFYPMEGTNITTNAAGPIADEYWDLTAPA